MSFFLFHFFNIMYVVICVFTINFKILIKNAFLFDFFFSLAAGDPNYTKSAIVALIQVTQVQLIVDQTP